MCFAHVIRNIRKRSFTTKMNKQLILDDIKKAQLTPNKQTFLMMTQLLCEKWYTAESEFIEYFKSQWLGVHCNWFEGAFKAKSDTLMYIVASSSCPAELANVAAYGAVAKQKWTSFDEFINHGYQLFWVVTVSSTEWASESTCTCPAFFKQNICKHIAAIAMRENILKYNDNSNPTLITATRKKAGREKNAEKALVKQK